ncbi:MAG: hypothetical protein HKN70_05135 [Gammaproteobacteria bacterium]|nr:hypothetical protein [Gammaproteobacteria bacterium]
MSAISPKTKLILITFLLVSCASANEFSKSTEHTYRLAENAGQPEARIEDVAWLTGAWTGEAFGERFEQTWNPPSAGSMVGFFKLLNKDSVNFYELLLIVEENNSLVMKVKHFHADFTAWEDKEDYVRFPLVHLEKDAIHFSGLSFYRQNNDDVIGYLAMRRKGELVEEKLIYRR